MGFSSEIELILSNMVWCEDRMCFELDPRDIIYSPLGQSALEIIGKCGKVLVGPMGLFSPEYKRYLYECGHRMLARRESLEIGRSQLTADLGFPDGLIQDIELGRHSPSHKTKRKIACALEVNVDYIWPEYSGATK